MYHGQVKVLPIFFTMATPGISNSDPFGLDSDVLLRSQQRVSGDELNQRSDVFSDWLFPNRKEERQLGQQLALMSVEPSLRLDAMKKAGINPLTAAGGIAGSAPSSSPQPTSSVNPIGDVAGAVSSIGGAFDSVASGISTLGKLSSEIDEINSSAQKNLAAAGLDKVNTDAVMTDNKYRADNWEAELNVKRQQFKNMQQELTNMKATHREIMTHCDEMISQIELNGSQKDYYDAMQLKIQEDLRWQKSLNDWCLSHNLMIRDSGVDGYIFNMLYNVAPDGDVDAFFNSYYDYCKNRNYASTKGVRDAEVDTAFAKSFNESLGTNEVDAEYAPFYAKLEANKDALVALVKEVLANPSNVRGVVAKLITLLANMGLSSQILNGPVNNASKPYSEHH